MALTQSMIKTNSFGTSQNSSVYAPAENIGASYCSAQIDSLENPIAKSLAALKDAKNLFFTATRDQALDAFRKLEGDSDANQSEVRYWISACYLAKLRNIGIKSHLLGLEYSSNILLIQEAIEASTKAGDHTQAFQLQIHLFKVMSACGMPATKFWLIARIRMSRRVYTHFQKLVESARSNIEISSWHLLDEAKLLLALAREPRLASLACKNIAVPMMKAVAEKADIFAVVPTDAPKVAFIQNWLKRHNS